MFIINYNNHSTINAILHDSSVHIYQLVQSLFVLINYIETSQSTTINNYIHVIWYIYVVCATLQSLLQSTSSWLVFLIYLITCNDESSICIINLGFSGANHIWKPSNVIQQAFSFICNQQSQNLQSLVAVTTAICSIVYFKLICAELDVICCYFNIYESQGETLHVEERIQCQLDFNFYKKFYKYYFLQCSSYIPWIEMASNYIGRSHNKLSENYILYLNSLRDGAKKIRSIWISFRGVAVRKAPPPNAKYFPSNEL